MVDRIAIVGAGLMGRTLALMLLQNGYRISLFDSAARTDRTNCGSVGAGMLSPCSELEIAEPLIYELGKDSINLWQQLIGCTGQSVFLQQAGTLVVAHSCDLSLLNSFHDNIVKKLKRTSIGTTLGGEISSLIKTVDACEIKSLEPSLSERFRHGVFLAQEGQIDNRRLMSVLQTALEQRGVEWIDGQDVQFVQPYGVKTSVNDGFYDLVIDCRGLGARSQLKGLRGVRGELVEVYAPDVVLNRPIRLLHPRYPLYIAPRPDSRFLIGATSIESDDCRPITVRSALELLSAAYSIDPGFGEAHIIETRVACRPAFTDNFPAIIVNPGLVHINGLYRHGFLLTPSLAQRVFNYVNGASATAGVTDISSTSSPPVIFDPRTSNQLN